MGINVNQIGFQMKLNKELDNSLFKLPYEKRKQIYLDIKRAERERREKAEEERLKKLNKD